MATMSSPLADVAHDTFPINGTDYIEFWVGNAKQSALYYRAVIFTELFPVFTTINSYKQTTPFATAF